MIIFVTTSKRNSVQTIYMSANIEDFDHDIDIQDQATKILNSSEDIARVDVYRHFGSVSYVTRAEWVAN